MAVTAKCNYFQLKKNREMRETNIYGKHGLYWHRARTNISILLLMCMKNIIFRLFSGKNESRLRFI